MSVGMPLTFLYLDPLKNSIIQDNPKYVGLKCTIFSYTYTILTCNSRRTDMVYQAATLPCVVVQFSWGFLSEEVCSKSSALTAALLISTTSPLLIAAWCYPLICNHNLRSLLKSLPIESIYIYLISSYLAFVEINFSLLRLFACLLLVLCTIELNAY